MDGVSVFETKTLHHVKGSDVYRDTLNHVLVSINALSSTLNRVYLFLGVPKFVAVLGIPMPGDPLSDVWKTVSREATATLKSTIEPVLYCHILVHVPQEYSSYARAQLLRFFAT